MKVNRHNKMYALGGMLKKFMMGGKMYEHGGQYHDANGNPTNEKGERIPDDSTIRPASRLERAGGLAGDDGSGLTWRNRGKTTNETSDTGSTIATGDQKALMSDSDAAAGTIASFNTEAVSPDMSQEQFEKAMQSPFVAEQFKGQDIQNPQQLSDAYKSFKNRATNAIRENTPAVANAAREFANTNDNFKIKLDKLSKDLGREPTDQDIADMMVTMNTDGLFGDLHGAVVSQFLSKNQLNAYTIPDGPLVSDQYGNVISEFTVEGQNVKSGGQIYTSFNDAGINDNEGMRKYFRDATEAGVDLTEGTAATEKFMEEWFKDPENEQYIFLGKNIRQSAIGRGGQGVAGLYNLMMEGQRDSLKPVTENRRAINDRAEERRRIEGQIQRLIGDVNRRNPRSEKAIEQRKEIAALREQLKSIVNPNAQEMAMGGKFKVLKSGTGAIGALEGLFKR